MEQEQARWCLGGNRAQGSDKIWKQGPSLLALIFPKHDHGCIETFPNNTFYLSNNNCNTKSLFNHKLSWARCGAMSLESQPQKG